MRFAAQARPAGFAQFAQRIFGLPEKFADDAGCALEGVDRFEVFLRSIGCRTRLSKLGIGEAILPLYAQDTLRIAHDEGVPPPRAPADARGGLRRDAAPGAVERCERDGKGQRRGR